MGLLREALIFLAAAVVTVPLSKRLGLGSILGYLAAGVVIGPSAIGLIHDPENVLHFAELGVVMFLFLIGLELQPRRLWQLRAAVFGLGSLQVVSASAVLAVLGKLAGLSWPAAILAGLALSLSSTAFALQLLGERNELGAAHGQAAFGILLFQDLAVIPILAVLPLLSGKTDGMDWGSLARGVAAVAAIVVAGRYVVRPVFRIVAGARSSELFTATALLLVLGTAAVMGAVGLSMALGAFLAGVLLADSDYRHELEADIEPFKGLLLGLFFISVGMSVNVSLAVSRPLEVIGVTLGLLAVKSALLFAIGKWTLKETRAATALAVVIGQGGEFAFVIFNLGQGDGVLPRETAELLVLAVSASMACTPLLALLFDRAIAPRLRRGPAREFDVSPEHDAPVIIAGFGRVGQVVGRVLRARRIAFTAMDINPEHIEFVTKFGNKVFYGDAARLDLLRAARADKARVFVLAVDDIDASLRIAVTVKEHFPNLAIIARARNRGHAYKLLDLGIPNIMRETFAGSLEMTGSVLEALGWDYGTALETLRMFREHDEKMLREAYVHLSDEKKLQEIALRARDELESLFEKDMPGRRAS